MKSRDEIFQVLKGILVDFFEIDPDKIHPQAELYEDLEVDSIDAVDLVVELRKITGKQIDPDEFRAVRTVDDVVRAVESIVVRP